MNMIIIIVIITIMSSLLLASLSIPFIIIIIINHYYHHHQSLLSSLYVSIFVYMHIRFYLNEIYKYDISACMITENILINSRKKLIFFPCISSSLPVFRTSGSFAHIRRGLIIAVMSSL